MKKTAAIFRLGQGMDLGELNDYTHQIALYLLLKVFYREINNNLQRTKNDCSDNRGDEVYCFK